MLLLMLYLSSVLALLPITTIAFPTGSNGLGTSNTLLDQLFGRDQAPHERSIAHVKRAKTVLIPTSIDRTDGTPIYTLPNSKPQALTNIFGNLTAPAGNDVPGGGPPSVINFKIGFGPVVIDGRIDTDTLDTDITVWVYGLSLGEFHGNLATGLSIDINLRFVRGEIKIYLKNKNEVWLRMSLVFSFGKRLEKDVKILTLPDLGLLNVPQRLTNGMPPATSAGTTATA